MELETHICSSVNQLAMHIPFLNSGLISGIFNKRMRVTSYFMFSTSLNSSSIRSLFINDVGVDHMIWNFLIAGDLFPHGFPAHLHQGVGA